MFFLFTTGLAKLKWGLSLKGILTILVQVTLKAFKDLEAKFQASVVKMICQTQWTKSGKGWQENVILILMKIQLMRLYYNLFLD